MSVICVEKREKQVDSLEDNWGYFNLETFDICFVPKAKHLDVVLRVRATAEAVLASSRPARAVDHLLRCFNLLENALNVAPADAWLW